VKNTLPTQIFEPIQTWVTLSHTHLQVGNKQPQPFGVRCLWFLLGFTHSYLMMGTDFAPTAVLGITLLFLCLTSELEK
jgi:hypothetical protein